MRVIPNKILPRPQCAERASRRLRLNSRDLFRNSQEVVIEHHGEEYRLRLTRNDKLILNK